MSVLYRAICDGCCTEAPRTADGALPAGWRSEDEPSCEWPFGDYVECEACAAESDAGRGGRDG